MRASHSDKRGWVRALRSVVAGVAILAVIGATFSFQTPRVQATGVPVYDAGNFLENAVSAIANTLSAAGLKTLEIKEWSVDGVFFALARIALQQMQKSMVRWINSGFKGRPAFVTDLGGFLTDTADQVAGQIIYGSDLKGLCSPFELNIRIALQVKFAERDRPPRCTLSQVVGNVDSFLAGKFEDGGLAGWFHMTMEPNNNYWGTSIAAEGFLLDRINARKEIDLNKLLWGKGFLSTEECKTVQQGPAQGPTPNGDTLDTTTSSQSLQGPTPNGDTLDTQVCTVTTPGDTVAAALNFKLSTGDQSLITADEVNEVITALFQQLSVQVFTGAGGLLGLTRTGGDYGTTSYLDKVGNPKFDTLPGQNQIGTTFISQAIRVESGYNALFGGLIATADRILARIAQLEALVKNEDDDEIWTCSNMDGIRAQVNQIRKDTLTKKEPSDRALTLLDSLEKRYAIAKQNSSYSSEAAQELIRITEEFVTLQTSGLIHNEVDTKRTELEVIPPIKKSLDALAAQVEASCRMTPKGGPPGDDDDDGE